MGSLKSFVRHAESCLLLSMCLLQLRHQQAPCLCNPLYHVSACRRKTNEVMKKSRTPCKTFINKGSEALGLQVAWLFLNQEFCKRKKWRALTKI